MEKSDMAIDAERTLDKSDASTDQTSLSIDPAREAKLLRKLDLYIAPIMTVIFLTAYLDRSNIGNAASAGMTEDIGMDAGELGSKLIKHDWNYGVFCSLLIDMSRCCHSVLRHLCGC